MTLTTEHAIPFFYNEHANLNRKPVIVDDVVIYGDAVNKVAVQLKYFTKEQPSILAIRNVEDFADTPRRRRIEDLPFIGPAPSTLSKEEYLGEIRDFSEMIQEWELPLDMEFPILHIRAHQDRTGRTAAEIYDILAQRAEATYGGKAYTTSSVAGHRALTILFDKENDNIYNNDFTKIRVFESDTEVKIAGYAPNVLEEAKLIQPGLFLNPKYSDIWGSILGEVQNPIPRTPEWVITPEDQIAYDGSIRIKHSLAVLANYLFSLSALIRHKAIYEDLVSADDRLLSHDDVNLLVGRRVAGWLTPRLEALISEGEESTSMWAEVRVPDTIVSPKMKDKYSFESTRRIIEFSDISYVVKEIFNLGYEMTHSEDGETAPILESFKALYHKPSKSMLADNAHVTVNKAVDNMIDGGYVVPVYHRVEGEDGRYYWRRYFRGTHTISLYDEIRS